jgi:tetratricopeptide (TPR) repeat protein
MPELSSPDAEDKIRQMLATIDSGKLPNKQVKMEMFDLLESYECWQPLFQLIQLSAGKTDSRSVEDYVRLAKVQNVYLENIAAAAETCVKAVDIMHMTYKDFQQFMLPKIIERDDWAAESKILQALWQKFSDADGKVAALERLCLLFEKKIFNDGELGSAYSRLLQIDPKNIKALRYFKVVYTQNYEWEKVANILQDLISASSHPQDIFRLAQELAAVSLYQLDRPRESIQILETYCEGSPLDASTIHYDAYQRLGDWQGCLKVLRQCLLSVEEDGGRSVLLLKIGLLEEKMGHLDVAAQSFRRAIQLWPKFLEPYERLVQISAQKKNWNEALEWLGKLHDHVEDLTLRARLDELKVRLQDGLRYAAD